MKTPSTFLHELVVKLTKSEKRYLKVQSGSGEKDYLQLLAAMQEQAVYDEEQLIREHEGANFLRHLAVNKRYLYEFLLQTLSRFKQKSLEEQVLEKVAAANLLIEKGLFSAAHSEWRKGQKVAQKYELYDLQILLSGIEKRLLPQLGLREADDSTIDRIFAREQHCLEQLQNTNQYWQLSQQLSRFQMRFQRIQTAEQHSQLERLRQQPRFQDASLATNFKSKTYFYQLNATYQFMQGNGEQAYLINSQYLDLLEAQPHFLKLYAERYLATLNNMLIDSLLNGKFDVLQEGINRLAMTPERPEFKSIKNIESRVFRQRYLLLLNWSISQKDFKQALEWIPAIKAGLDRHGKKIENHHRFTFYYLMAYLLFQNGRYEQALHWNNQLLNTTKQEVVKEIFYFARVLNLLIHFELENYDLLESLLISTPKYLKARRPLFASEQLLFRFLTKLLRPLTKADRQELLASFHADIQQLAQDPKEQRLFSYLDLREWRNGQAFRA